MSEPAILVEDLTKSFRVVRTASTLKQAALGLLRRRSRVARAEVLKGISFHVDEGETIGIIGRNGSGKSTILALLAGIYLPNAGRITVRGRIATLLDLGAGLNPEVTAEDNAVVCAMIFGLSRRDALARLDQMIAYAGLEEFAETKVKHFSSGMILRLGFSIVIHTDPDVLLVDEVLAVGDEAFQHRCRQTIRAFQERGKSIVFVSHDLEAIREVAQRVLWLDQGHLRLAGPTEEVLAAYHEAMLAAGD